MMKDISFLNPEFFWLFLLLPLAIAWQLWKRKEQTATLKISSVKGFKLQKSLLAKLKPFLLVLRLLALSALIIAMARPRKVDISSQTKSTKGIDIVIEHDELRREPGINLIFHHHLILLLSQRLFVVEYACCCTEHGDGKKKC